MLFMLVCRAASAQNCGKAPRLCVSGGAGGSRSDGAAAMDAQKPGNGRSAMSRKKMTVLSGAAVAAAAGSGNTATP